jgi:hypothetical protein
MGATCQLPTGASPQICLTGDGSALATNKGTASNALGVWQKSANQTAGGSISTGSPTITMAGAPLAGVAGWTVFDYTADAILGQVSTWTGSGPSTLTLTANAKANGSGSADSLIFYGPQALVPTANPSGPAGFAPHTATLRWKAYATQPNGSSSNYSVNNNYNPISIGDVLVLIGQWENSSAALPTGSCPSGWNQAGNAVGPNGTLSVVMCWQLQTANVAAGALDTISSLTATANADRNASWLLMDYGATAGINTVDAAASGCQYNSSSSISAPTPVHTTTYAKDTLVSIALEYSAGNRTSFAAPSGSSLRFYTPIGGGSPIFVGLADQVLTATGPTTRNWTLTPAAQSMGCDIAIHPN